MRIAVTYDKENGQIFQHFGHTEQFKLYQVENGRVVSSVTLPTNGTGHGALAALLAQMKADVLICGGIGGGAKNVLAAAGIELISGVSGPVDEAVKLYLEGKLHDDPSAECRHHDHGDHECGHHDGAPQGECRGCGHGEPHGCN